MVEGSRNLLQEDKEQREWHERTIEVPNADVSLVSGAAPRTPCLTLLCSSVSRLQGDDSVLCIIVCDILRL